MATPMEHLRRTRRLMWAILVCTTVTSMAGNIDRAVEHQNLADTRGSILAAAIPPLALLSLTHLTGLWSRITARGFVYWCFLGAVACITAAAFRLSFDALRSLAVQYGYSHADAALFPLILDGLVAVCTLGLVMLSRITPPPEARSADGNETAEDLPHQAAIKSIAPPSSTSSSDDAPRDAVESAALTRRDAWSTQLNPADCDPAADAPHNGALRTAAALTAAPLQLASPPRLEDDATDAHLVLAHQLVRTKCTTAEVDVVHRVLTHAAENKSSREVAAEVGGISASSVQRILKAAKSDPALNQRMSHSG